MIYIENAIRILIVAAEWTDEKPGDPMSRQKPTAFTYDRQADALGIELVPDATSTRMVRIAPDCNADLDRRGRLVSIEILQASAYYPKAQLKRLAPTSDELTLLEAAGESELAVTTLKNQIRAGKPRGVKRGRDWFVERAELLNYLENRSPAGRPDLGAEVARCTGDT